MELSLGDGVIFGRVIFGSVYCCFFLLCIWIHVWICVLFQCFMDIYFYVWYVSGFEVGMNLCACMNIFLLWYLFSLSLHMCGVYGICALFIISFIIHPFATYI